MPNGPEKKPRWIDKIGSDITKVTRANAANLEEAAQTLQQTLQQHPEYMDVLKDATLRHLVETSSDPRLQRLAHFAKEVAEPHQTSALVMGVLGLFADEILPADSPVIALLKEYSKPEDIKSSPSHEITGEDVLYTHLREFHIDENSDQITLRFDSSFETTEFFATFSSDKTMTMDAEVVKDGHDFLVTIPLEKFRGIKTATVTLAMRPQSVRTKQLEVDTHEIYSILIQQPKFAAAIATTKS